MFKAFNKLAWISLSKSFPTALPHQTIPFRDAGLLAVLFGVSPEIHHSNTHTFFSLLFIYLFTEREGGKKRGKHPCVVPSHTSPNWGPGAKCRHVPWLGIELATLWFALSPLSCTSQGFPLFLKCDLVLSLLCHLICLFFYSMSFCFKIILIPWRQGKIY